MKYLCELIQNQKPNIISERFYRDGESENAVREQLSIFQWPKGYTWRITEVG